MRKGNQNMSVSVKDGLIRWSGLGGFLKSRFLPCHFSYAMLKQRTKGTLKKNVKKIGLPLAQPQSI